MYWWVSRHIKQRTHSLIYSLYHKWSPCGCYKGKHASRPGPFSEESALLEIINWSFLDLHSTWWFIPYYLIFQPSVHFMSKSCLVHRVEWAAAKSCRRRWRCYSSFWFRLQGRQTDRQTVCTPKCCSFIPTFSRLYDKYRLRSFVGTYDPQTLVSWYLLFVVLEFRIIFFNI